MNLGRSAWLKFSFFSKLHIEHVIFMFLAGSDQILYPILGCLRNVFIVIMLPAEWIRQSDLIRLGEMERLKISP